MTDATRASDDALRMRFADLERRHTAALAQRSRVALGSDDYVSIQKALAAMEVEMNLISGVLAERAGRGHVAVRGRE